MQTTRKALVGAALGTLALAVGPTVAAVADQAPADLLTRCIGTADAVTVPGDLYVPAGESCILQGTTVQGDVQVRAGGNLIAQDGATLHGDVVVRRDAYLEIVDAEVLGSTLLTSAYGSYAEGGTLGDIEARNAGFHIGLNSAQASHQAVGTETSLESSWVEGDVSTRGGVLTDLRDTVVTGGLTVTGMESGSMICASEIDGAVAISQTGGGVVQLGDGPTAGCDGNVFGADVTLESNATESGTHLVGNVVRGALDCTDNSPAPVGSDNRVRGGAGGQCADLQPASSSAGDLQPQRSSETSLERAQARSAQAHAEATLAGPADIGQ